MPKLCIVFLRGAGGGAGDSQPPAAALSSAGCESDTDALDQESASTALAHPVGSQPCDEIFERVPPFPKLLHAVSYTHLTLPTTPYV